MAVRVLVAKVTMSDVRSKLQLGFTRVYRTIHGRSVKSSTGHLYKFQEKGDRVVGVRAVEVMEKDISGEYS